VYSKLARLVMSALFVSLFWPSPESYAFEPVVNPRLETTRATGDVHIDGKLDEAAWSGAARAGNFVERFPGDNVEPVVETEVLVTFDDENFYVGFICRDDPERIRATMSQRDQYGNDDEVILCLDSYGEAAWAYEFCVNPYGVQKDMLWTKTHGEDAGFDLVWSSAAHVNDSGYTVEMAVPFASLRFPNRDVQSWRIDFQRNHPRESYRVFSWSANTHDEQCWPCQWGTVNGISGVRSGKGLEILPSFVSTQAGEMAGLRTMSASRINPDTTFSNGDVLGQASIGAKYSVNSDVTIEGTYNPDFSQIEADAAQVDVNTTISLMFPEKRPFFQEGSDLFITPFNSFYTRMVNDPNMAAKATARWSKFSLAYTAAHDEQSPYSIPVEERGWTRVIGGSTVNVVRGLGNVGNGSTIGFLASQRSYDRGGAGTILSADGELRLNSSYSVVGQGIISHTREPEGLSVDSTATFDSGKYTADLDGESYWGTAFITEFRRRSRHWNFTLDYNQLTPTYRTQIGYDPWNDQRNGFFFTTYHFRPATGLFERISPQVGIDRRWSFNEGENGFIRKWAHGYANLSANLRWAQTQLGAGYTQGSERWFGAEYRDLWSVHAEAYSRPHDKVAASLSTVFGRGPAVYADAVGKEVNFSAELEIKPIDRLVIEPSYNYSRSAHLDTDHELFKEVIWRTRVRLQVNPRFSLRLVGQYDDYDVNVAVGAPEYYHMSGRTWEIDPLVTYRVNSFSMLYLGSTHDFSDFGVPTDGFNLPRQSQSIWRQSQRQFFIKLQYLFQV
jgi:hypothetical protein